MGFLPLLHQACYLGAFQALSQKILDQGPKTLDKNGIYYITCIPSASVGPPRWALAVPDHMPASTLPRRLGRASVNSRAADYSGPRHG